MVTVHKFCFKFPSDQIFRSKFIGFLNFWLIDLALMIGTTNLFCETHLFESLVASRRITQSDSRRSTGTVETKFNKTKSCFNRVNS
jgi:hypothetical protein